MAVSFDGSSGLYRGVGERLSDSAKGTALAWFKVSADAPTDTFNVILSGKGASNYNLLLHWYGPDTKVYFSLRQDDATTMDVKSSSTITSADGWVCFIVSYDLTNSLLYLYQGNTDVSTEVNAPSGDESAFADSTEWSVGIYDVGGTAKYQFYGDMALVAFWPGVYVDLTDDDERRNLISNDGKPVGFGVDGSGRGGRSGIDTPPIIFFSGAFVKNLGTGGAFTLSGELSSTGGPDVYRASSDRLTYGTRWYDSDRSGFSYPRTEMQRETSGTKGLRVGVDELDELDRDDFKEVDFDDLLDSEEDTEDVV